MSLYVCVCVCTCLCLMLVYAHSCAVVLPVSYMWKSKVYTAYLPLFHSTIFFNTWSLIEPGSGCFNQIGWPDGILRLQTNTTTCCFHLVAGDLNSCLLAYVASHLHPIPHYALYSMPVKELQKMNQMGTHLQSIHNIRGIKAILVKRYSKMQSWVHVSRVSSKNLSSQRN